jgi:hypothetical protein
MARQGQINQKPAVRLPTGAGAEQLIPLPSSARRGRDEINGVSVTQRHLISATVASPTQFNEGKK